MLLTVIMASLFGGLLSWMIWLTLAQIETDRTQEVVLERLGKQDTLIRDLETDVNTIPDKVDDEDRWYRSEQILFREMQEIEHNNIRNDINRLEQYHKPNRTGE